MGTGKNSAWEFVPAGGRKLVRIVHCAMANDVQHCLSGHRDLQSHPFFL